MDASPNMDLCRYCQTIPWSFFDTHDYESSQSVLLHASYETLTMSAEAGCPFCQLVFTCSESLAAKFSIEQQQKVKDSKSVRLWQFGFKFLPAINEDRIYHIMVGIGSYGWLRRMPIIAFTLAHTKVPSSVSGASMDQPIADTMLVSSWLSDCVENHTECGPKSSAFTPTRLLDIGDASSSESPRIISPATSKKLLRDVGSFNYVALSYCWGKNMPKEVKSTTKSIDQFMQSVTLEKLPRTFRDAIGVTRQLGLRYIWIDALCIIQDSPQDWEGEAAVMGQIYSNALFTLAALSATGVTEGFHLHESRKGRESGFYHVRPGDRHTVEEAIYFYRPMKTQYLHTEDVLSTRGWTLQERELSRRRITYSTDGIQWECRKSCWNDELPWGSRVATALHLGHIISNHHTGKSGDTEGYEYNWRDIVSDYTSRLFTKQEDRLTALSGVARKMKDMIGDDYAAGIWRKHALEGLLWTAHWKSQPEHPLRRPQAYIAPSWSWASIIGRVHWDAMVDRRSLANTATILALQAEPTGLDSYGAVRGGVLKITGQIKIAFCRGGALKKYRARRTNSHWRSVDKPYTERGRELIDPISRKCVAFIAHDIDQEGEQPGTVFCLRVRPYPSWGHPVIADAIKKTAAKMGSVRQDVSHGLALIPTERGNGKFQRIGYVKYLLDAWLDDTPESTILIL